MAKTKLKHYICTRPTLASELMQKGHVGRVERHLWDSSRSMWIFEVDDDLVETVTAYYHKIGKATPFDRVVSSEVTA